MAVFIVYFFLVYSGCQVYIGRRVGWHYGNTMMTSLQVEFLFCARLKDGNSTETTPVSSVLASVQAENAFSPRFL